MNIDERLGEQLRGAADRAPQSTSMPRAIRHRVRRGRLVAAMLSAVAVAAVSFGAVRLAGIARGLHGAVPPAGQSSQTAAPRISCDASKAVVAQPAQGEHPLRLIADADGAWTIGNDKHAIVHISKAHSVDRCVDLSGYRNVMVYDITRGAGDLWAAIGSEGKLREPVKGNAGPVQPSILRIQMDSGLTLQAVDRIPLPDVTALGYFNGHVWIADSTGVLNEADQEGRIIESHPNSESPVIDLAPAPDQLTALTASGIVFLIGRDGRNVGLDSLPEDVAQLAIDGTRPSHSTYIKTTARHCYALAPGQQTNGRCLAPPSAEVLALTFDADRGYVVARKAGAVAIYYGAKPGPPPGYARLEPILIAPVQATPPAGIVPVAAAVAPDGKILLLYSDGNLLRVSLPN